MGSRILAAILSVMTLVVLAACGESYTEYSGIVQSVDLEHQIVYVISDGEDSPFRNPCAIDCRTAAKHDSVMLLDADSASLNLSSIDLADIWEGDSVDVFLSDTQAQKAAEGYAEAYQIQISRPDT